MNGLGYREKMIAMLNKLVKDEMSAAIFYEKAANELTGPEAGSIASELKEHAGDEIKHFNQLIEFASSHDVLGEIKVELDESVVQFSPLTDIKIVMKKVQELEKQAIDDYTKAALCAKKHDNIEANKFFSKIMNEEIEHFDELAYVNGDTRPLVGLSSLNFRII